jgi:hypothetical protein
MPSMPGVQNPIPLFPEDRSNLVPRGAILRDHEHSRPPRAMTAGSGVGTLPGRSRLPGDGKRADL